MFIESVEHNVMNYCFMIQLKLVPYCVMNDPRLPSNTLQTYEPAQHSKTNTFLHAEHAT